MMTDTANYYGHQEEAHYPLAARIWGHRLREGQHWMEYLLEFLNVLAGFDYNLGCGLDKDKGNENYIEGYIRLPKMGLRRFVFYDEREKTQDEMDDYAKRKLLNDLKQVISNGTDNENAILCVRDLFRSLSAVEESRSWFAKSLLPINHHLLFWEGEKSGSKSRSKLPPALDLPVQAYDAHISLSGRNFFARGGEVYYLILSAGTEHSLELRNKISTKLDDVLHGNNQDLGTIANLIDQVWYKNQAGSKVEPYKRSGKLERYPLGWIPDPHCSIYGVIAEDVANFLENDLEPFELLALLACLIGFHLTLYIYHRAQPDSAVEPHNERCYESCRPRLLIHVAEGDSGNAVREISERLFRQQGTYQEQRGRKYIEKYVFDYADDIALDKDSALTFINNVMNFFSLSRKGSNPQISKLQMQFSRSEIDKNTFLTKYAEILWKIAEDDFVKNFLGVHKKLAKAAGFVAPKKGTGGRFVFSDDLLKVLVLANIKPHSSMSFEDFLERLYLRYGIIVGPEEAEASGLFTIETINRDYYQLNYRFLLAKMKRAGLATQYSDATVLVQG